MSSTNDDTARLASEGEGPLGGEISCPSPPDRSNQRGQAGGCSAWATGTGNATAKSEGSVDFGRLWASTSKESSRSKEISTEEKAVDTRDVSMWKKSIIRSIKKVKDMPYSRKAKPGPKCSKTAAAMPEWIVPRAIDGEELPSDSISEVESTKSAPTFGQTRSGRKRERPPTMSEIAGVNTAKRKAIEAKKEDPYWSKEERFLETGEYDRSENQLKRDEAYVQDQLEHLRYQPSEDVKATIFEQVDRAIGAISISKHLKGPMNRILREAALSTKASMTVLTEREKDDGVEENTALKRENKSLKEQLRRIQETVANLQKSQMVYLTPQNLAVTSQTLAPMSQCVIGSQKMAQIEDTSMIETDQDSIGHTYNTRGRGKKKERQRAKQIESSPSTSRERHVSWDRMVPRDRFPVREKDNEEDPLMSLENRLFERIVSMLDARFGQPSVKKSTDMPIPKKDKAKPKPESRVSVKPVETRDTEQFPSLSSSMETSKIRSTKLRWTQILGRRQKKKSADNSAETGTGLKATKNRKSATAPEK